MVEAAENVDTAVQAGCTAEPGLHWRYSATWASESAVFGIDMA